MFFNEDLYLEGSDAEEIKVEPTTEEEIAEACKDCKAEGLDNVIGEGAGFYTYALEQLEVLNEGYFNLREKMMNVEHVAALKEKDGLVSESEQILSESVDGFFNGLKNFFVKIGNMIKNLFNRFVEFIMGHVVSVKKIKEMNSANAWKLYESRRKDKKAEKIKIANYDATAVNKGVALSRDILMEVAKSVDAIVADADKKMGKAEGTGLDYRDGIIKKATAMFESLSTLGKTFLKPTGADNAVGVQADLTKNEVDLTQKLFDSRYTFVVEYQKKLDAVKANKAAAMKVVDNGIKAINKLKASKNDKVNANRAGHVKQLRWMGTFTSKQFSVVTSVLSSFYSESLKIVRHVVGAQAAADVKKEVKKLGEGFDYEAYFNEAFN